MKETHSFLMPDYFPDFSCKMGGCRAACCVGWPISISMQNYFHLLGMDCSQSLRNRIDCGLHIYDHPTQERYARFEPRYNGDCPLRQVDGRCGLHAEMGEEVLQDICRLYPRGIRVEDGIYECSCANSCEAVLEMLYAKQEPITFSRKAMTIQLPPISGRSTIFETLGLEQKIRLHFIGIIQNRDIPLPQRILCLGTVLDKMDRILANHDKPGLDLLLTEPPQIQQIQHPDIDHAHLQFGLHIAEQMLELLDERSQSIRQFGEAALAYFRNGENELDQYLHANHHFEALFPNWENFFEHMLVNHMFFSQFPFQDRPESMHSEYVALCALYALLRFLALGWMVKRDSTDDLIDVMAAAFRLVDHTEFDRYASHLLHRLNCTEPNQLHDLVRL